MLKVDGNTAEIWQYTKATLSTLNFNIIAQGSNQATIKVNDNTYVLKLTGVGSSHTLALFNVDNTFASPDVAAEVLNQIYQIGQPSRLLGIFLKRFPHVKTNLALYW